MSQHDQVIANDTGAAVRADINSALAALFGNSSGATAPATTVAYQWWADTTTGLLKIRNAANSAWVTVGTLSLASLGLTDGSQAGAFTTLNVPAAAAVRGNDVEFSGASPVGIRDTSGVASNRVLDLWHDATSGDNIFSIFYTEGAVAARGSIDFNRGATATRFNTTSDARLKTKNGPALYDPTWIARVAASIFNVTWHESGHRADTFVAQDLYELEPDAVSKGDAAPDLEYVDELDDRGVLHRRCISQIWGVDPSKLVARLILEVAAQRDELDALKAGGHG